MFVDLPVFLHPVIIGAILGVLALVIGSKFGVITEEEKMYRESLLIRPIESNEKAEMAITKRYPYYLMISGVFVIIVTFAFYYYPLTLQ